MLTLILGGARSGKSSYAERLAAGIAGPDGGVLYVATAQALDEEMARRIARHRRSRPTAWHTLEEPLRLGTAIADALTAQAPPDGQSAHEPRAIGVVLVDCITIWLSNLLFGPDSDPDRLPDEETAEASVHAALDELLITLQTREASAILVSNEVGMGLVPPYPMGRLYRDLLGRVNARLAGAADEVYLLVAGIPLRIKPQSS